MNAFAELRKKIIEAVSSPPPAFDYSFIESQKMIWEQLASLSNSAIIVMDIYTDKPLFVSDTLFNAFQLETSSLRKNITTSLEDYIHPEDLKPLAAQKFSGFCFLLHLPVHQKQDYKNIYQYRIKIGENDYVWVLEQQQVIQLDKEGNARITLSVVDVMPDQNDDNRFSNQLFNVKTGEMIVPEKAQVGVPPSISLTAREKEILSMIQKGYLSKEISQRLCISFNTVNTHRQNILKKFQANNSLEAIRYAKKLGLLT